VAHLSEKEGYLPSSAVGGVSDPVISSTSIGGVGSSTAFAAALSKSQFRSAGQ
jgi:hypothetical protein